jgi:hypothetical protein
MAEKIGLNLAVKKTGIDAMIYTPVADNIEKRDQYCSWLVLTPDEMDKLVEWWNDKRGGADQDELRQLAEDLAAKVERLNRRIDVLEQAQR